MTGIDHQDNPAIDEAARWLSSLRVDERPHPPVPALRKRFGLSPLECCIALREANLRHARAS